ncbi:hypothetical protein KEM56_002187 [Ascosphaera pollenicola]|nr:hypothetical protein KEM56_002187 [Ascosphaera pollenicola]
MGVQFLEQEAREKLHSIRQNYPSETVSELYTRIVPLFNDAQTPVPEQIERFLDAMHTNIAQNLSGGSYPSLEALRDVAVTAEACYRRFNRTLHRASGGSGPGTSSFAPRGRGRDHRDANPQMGSTFSESQMANNRKLCPTLIKPTTWQGPCFFWFPARSGGKLDGSADSRPRSSSSSPAHFLISSHVLEPSFSSASLPDLDDLNMNFQPHVAFGSSIDTLNGSASALSFLDTGATSNFMSESYAMRCGLQTKELPSPIPLTTTDDQIFCMPHVCGPMGCLSTFRNGVRSLTVFAKKPSTLAKIVDPFIKALSALSFIQEAQDPDAEVFLVSCSREAHTTATLAATTSPVMGAADSNTYAVLSALLLYATAISQSDYNRHMKGPTDFSEEELKKLIPPQHHH